MTIEGMIDLINRKISGLNTLVIEKSVYKKAFTNRDVYHYVIYRVDYPECVRVCLQKFEHEVFLILEADVIEFLFDILISERYKEWQNYKLIEENVKWLKENFLK